MTQKCNGVKILDLDSKIDLTGGEYVVIAEKGANYKVPMDQIGDLIVNGSKFRAAVENVYTTNTPAASVRLEDDEFKFTFGIPVGEAGTPGKDGKDGVDGKDGKDGIPGVAGIDGDTIRTVIAYTSTSTTVRPATPTGGSWNPVTNQITYPTGWSGSDANPNGYVWMSTASFSSQGTQVTPWSMPVRLTGDKGDKGQDGTNGKDGVNGVNGRDGVDGLNIEFVYKLTKTSLIQPTKPTGNTQAQAISDGWTDHPTGISEEFQCEWVCSHTLNPATSTWSEWEGPSIWSKWGINGKDGDGVEYIYQRTKLPTPPKDITVNNATQDEFIPPSGPGEQPWTDDPKGVNQEFIYEWVSKRKYNGSTKTWGNFSKPALWAKYGDNGQDGLSLRVMYTKTAGSDTQPADPNRLNINPGSVWSLAMPKITGKQALWAIQALVTYDNQLYIDTNLPEDKRGWQGPYLMSGVAGLDGNNFNYQVEAFKQSNTKPNAPTSNDPYNPGGGWVTNPDSSDGTWWKCIANVNGQTGTVIQWGAVIRITGQGIIVKGTLNSQDELPQSGNNIGDAYIIDSNMWVWNGTNWQNAGSVKGIPGEPGPQGPQGPQGTPGQNGINPDYIEYRFKRNNSYDNPPTLDKQSRYPAGWNNSAPLPSDGTVLWCTFALIDGSNNILKDNTGWCNPYYMTGSPGASGIPGVGYEVRYCKGTLTTYTGAQWQPNWFDENPLGWSLTVPELVQGEENNYIWFMQARIQEGAGAIGKILQPGWSKPNPLAGILVPEPTGKQPILYPQGIYRTDIEYENDGSTAPYVWDTTTEKFYYLKSVMKWRGSQHNNESPGTDTSSAWQVFNHFEAVYANVLVTPNALVGSAVFNNQFMFSQQGINSTGGFSNEYQKINMSNNGQNVYNESNAFRPNMLLNFLTGEAYFAAGGIHLGKYPETTKIELSTKTGQITSTTKIDKDGFIINKSNDSGLISIPVAAKLDKTGLSANVYTGDLYERANHFNVDKDGMSFITQNHVSQGFPNFYKMEHIKCNKDGTGSLATGGITWDAQGILVANGLYETFSGPTQPLEVELPSVPDGYGKQIIVRTYLYTGAYMGHTFKGTFDKVMMYNNSGSPKTYNQGQSVILPPNSLIMFSYDTQDNTKNWRGFKLFSFG